MARHVFIPKDGPVTKGEASLLLGRLAHDNKGALTCINGYLQLCKKDQPEEVLEQIALAREIVGGVKDKCSSLYDVEDNQNTSTLLQDVAFEVDEFLYQILRITRQLESDYQDGFETATQHIREITAGMSNLYLQRRDETFNVGDLARNLAKIGRSKCEKVMVNYVGPDDVDIDHGRRFARMQLYNNVVNAVLAARNFTERPEVTIESHLVNLTPAELENLGPNSGLYTGDDPFVKIAVIDNGIGIPEGDLEKIFSPTYTTNGGKGSGLALVRLDCLALHGYKIVESTLGQGTKMTTLIPVNYKEPQKEQLDLEI